MATAHLFSYSVSFALCLFSATLGLAQETTINTNSATSPPSEAVSAQVQKLVTESSQSLDNGNLDDALSSVDSALQLDPHNASLYELRGSIYIQKKLWNRAASDYTAALQIDPSSTAFKYKLAEIDFLQKDYAAARPGFIALENDPALGELAKYKVFLCDLFDYRESLARDELDALNKAAEKRQAYYFCNAIWALFHQDRAGATKWITSASQLYSASEVNLYLSIINQLDRLHAPIVTFTTRKGITYDKTKVFVQNDGLRISTTKGWVTIPFEDLPSDLSGFPADLQKQIEAKKNPAPSVDIDSELLSFSTKGGKKYDRTKWSVEDNGLRILTSDGWTTIPFDQLPEDISSFPEEARTQIALKQKALLDKALATSHPSIDNVALTTSKTDVTATDIESSQSDLHPDEAKDCHFGICVAIDGNLTAVGADGATYLYENNVLKARLCAEADSTQTGDLVNSISLSNRTLVTSTRAGVYVWVEADSAWKLQAHLDIPNPSTVVVDGDNLVVCTNGNGTTGNLVSFYTRRDGIWHSIPRNINRDGSWHSADLFGHIVALKNNKALIGSPNWNKDAYDNTGPAYSGRVFVEKFDGKAWNEEAQLTSSDVSTAANQFGQSVALSDDLIAISSSNRDNIDYAPHHGTVHLFQKAGNSWTRTNIIKGPNPSDDASFGCGPLRVSNHVLAIVDLGMKAHVSNVILDTGTSTDKPGDIKGAGAVYVYENQVLQATLMAPDPVDNLRQSGSPDQFGSCLALNGNTLLVGAPGKDGGSGAVYIWKHQNNQWQLDTELKGFHKQPNFNY